MEQARERATPVDWSSYRPPRPHLFLQQDHAVSPVVAPPKSVTRETQHVRVFKGYDLGDLRRYIDWQPFFNAWEMKGSFPDILNNPASGPAARKLYDDAQEMFDRAIEEKWLTARGVFGFFPANAVGDDIEAYTDDSRAEVAGVSAQVTAQKLDEHLVP